MQGDGTANSPTNLQISESNEEASTTPPPTTGAGEHAVVQINTFVSCPQGFVCPDSNDFLYDITIDRSQCSEAPPVHCLFNATPLSFSGDLTVVTFDIINFGSFDLTVTLPPTPPGLTLHLLDLTCDPPGALTQTGPTTFSGTIQEDTFSFCLINYKYSPV
jgi:hypothetical protein